MKKTASGNPTTHHPRRCQDITVSTRPGPITGKPRRWVELNGISIISPIQLSTMVDDVISVCRLNRIEVDVEDSAWTAPFKIER